MSPKPKIGIIIASTRPKRVGDKVGKWLFDQTVENNEAEFDLIDLKEVNLPFLSEPEEPSGDNYQLESSKKWSKIINALDGFIFVTPEYNNGIPASLKNAIDSLYSEWAKKPVVFLGYGSVGAARCIEQLISVTAKIGMVPRSIASVRLLKAGDMWDGDQIKTDHIHGNIERMIDDIVWWSNLLKSARNS